MITTTCLSLWMSWLGAVGLFSPLDAAPPDATRAAQRRTPTTRLKARTAAKAIPVRRDSGQRGHVDAALARPVELAEEDPLPRAEREAAVIERDENLRSHQ